MGNITNNLAMAAKSKKAPGKKPVYGKPEKRNYRALILGWGFIIIAAAIITWMIVINPPQKRLSCTSPGGHSASLIEFGTCMEE